MAVIRWGGSAFRLTNFLGKTLLQVTGEQEVNWINMARRTCIKLMQSCGVFLDRLQVTVQKKMSNAPAKKISSKKTSK